MIFFNAIENAMSLYELKNFLLSVKLILEVS